MCGPVVYTPVTANARLSKKASECAPKTGGPGSLPPEAHGQWGRGEDKCGDSNAPRQRHL